MRIILSIFALAISTFTQIMASDIDKLDFSLTKLKVIKPDTTTRYLESHQYLTTYFAKVTKDNDEEIVGLGFKSLGLWANGKTATAGIRMDKVIKPLKDKEFYIGFANGYYGVVFHNLTTNFYKRIKDRLIALKDIDNDGVAEIITLNNYTYAHRFIQVFKIINKDTNPSVTLLFKHGVPSNFPNDGISQYSDIYLYYTIKYFKDDSFIVAKQHKHRCEEKIECKKLYDDYFVPFSKEQIVTKSTYYYDDTGYNSLDRILKYYKISEQEKMKLQYSADANRLQCKKLYLNKKIDTPNILMCKRGKGVIKTRSGVLFVKDFDFESRYINSYKTNRYTFLFDKKYLLISDNKTKKAKYLLWKDLLGYQPFDVKYFDTNRLIVQANIDKIVYYKVTEKSSSIAKEQW